jgi:hypothetical protein
LYSDLGMLHLGRYERSDDLWDLDRAIGAGRIRPRGGIPSGPRTAGFCNNLANALRTRFELHFGRKGQPIPDEDLDLATVSWRSTWAASRLPVVT